MFNKNIRFIHRYYEMFINRKAIGIKITLKYFYYKELVYFSSHMNSYIISDWSQEQVILPRKIKDWNDTIKSSLKRPRQSGLDLD